MADLQAICEALAVRLETVTGIQVSPYVLSSPTPPCVYIRPGETDYHLASRNGAEEWEMFVVALVPLNSDIGAQQQLYRLIASSGTDSVKEAVEGTGGVPQTLGGLVSDVTVRSHSPVRTYTLGATQTEVLGVEWTLEVLT